MGHQENSILAQEVLNHVHRHKRKQVLDVIKVDLEKAYVKVNWDFLQSTILEFGFPGLIVSLIMWGVHGATLYISLE